LRRTMVLAFVLAMAMVSGVAMAQEGGGQEGGRRRGGGGGGGGGGNWDPAQFRQQQLTRLKEQLKASDEEFQVLQPKLEKVMEARTAAMGGFGRGGRGGPGGGGQRQETEVGKAREDLRAALEKEQISPEEVASKLAAYRAARDKVNESLKAAQEELRELVTPEQEAVLVVNGYLE
jgi:flagellar motility protein MotE (MotC chaperone)